MPLGKVAEMCYNITSSFLRLQINATEIMKETQRAVLRTRNYFLNDIFQRWDPLNNEISFAYNGGKDCQVLLLLYLSSLWEYYMIQIYKSQYEPKFHNFPLKKLPTVFINSNETFPVLESFITMTTQRYHLSLYEDKQCSGRNKDMATEIQKYLNLNPMTKAIIIGVRHSDPYGDTLKTIQMTDSDWPQFIRLQPLLEWNLANVWSFLLYSGEPICPLYRYGYTSLGEINNTIPNPYLKKQSDGKNCDNDLNVTSKNFPFQYELDNSIGSSIQPNSKRWETDDVDLIALGDEYLPGWYLIDDSKERAGRIKKSIDTKDNAVN